MWYTMKFDRRMMVPFKDNGDVVSMMRGNDGHGYLYVGGMGGQCGRRTRDNEHTERADGEANDDVVGDQRGGVGRDNDARHVRQNDEGAGDMSNR